MLGQPQLTNPNQPTRQRRVDSSLIGIPFSQDAAQQVEQQNAQEAATRDLSENIRKIYMVTDM